MLLFFSMIKNPNLTEYLQLYKFYLSTLILKFVHFLAEYLFFATKAQKHKIPLNYLFLWNLVLWCFSGIDFTFLVVACPSWDNIFCSSM